MKKAVLSVLILVSFTIASQAQGFKLGIKAGANFNKISGQSFNDGFNLSYHLGGFAEINLTKTWGIQPEVLWNQSSTKPSSFQAVYGSATTSATFNSQENIKLDYL